MKKCKLIQIQDELPGSHYFTYKGKEYQFNIDFFKCYSRYFSNLQFEMQINKHFKLLGDEPEESINLSEESIRNFINFVHRQQIPIHDENVIFLNYLAKKYEVNLLINLTNDYISSNRKDLVLQLLLLYQNDARFNPEQYEDIISKNLLDYIDDDNLLSLNISMLHRIVDKFLIEKESSNEIDFNDKLMTFLFKCIDKFGRPASVLFTHINFAHQKAEYLNRLLFDLNNEFDFHFINCCFLKTIYQNQSDLLKNEGKNQMIYDDLLKKMDDKFKSANLNHYEEEINKLKSEIKQIKIDQTQQLNEQKRQYDDKINKLKSDTEQMQKKYEDEISKLKGEIEKMKSDQAQQLNEHKMQFNDEISKFKKELNSQFIQLNEQNKKIESLVPNSPYGIIEFMKKKSNMNKNPYESKLIDVETTRVCDGDIKNLFDKSIDTHFRIYQDQNGFILLDFKEKKINFSKYYFSVPSKKNGCFSGWPKSWKIEGSNNKQTWDMIDNKKNDSSLCGFGNSNTFICQNITNEFYRFIRIQEIISYNGADSESHHFILSEIEFYGSIKE